MVRFENAGWETFFGLHYGSKSKSSRSGVRLAMQLSAPDDRHPPRRSAAHLIWRMKMESPGGEMNEDILKLAKESGLVNDCDGVYFRDNDSFMHFARLIEARTIERCAVVCDELAELNRENATDSMWQWGECAAAIRAMKEE